MANDRLRGASPPLRDGQSANPARTGGVDPLAELARLIGEDESFTAIAHSGRQREPRAEELAHRDQPRPLESARSRATKSRLERTTEPPADYDYDEYDESDYSNGHPSRRRGLRLLVALIGLALVGSGGAVAYWVWSGGLVNNDEAPVIIASTTPRTMLPPGDDVPSSERPLAGGGSPVDANLAAAPRAAPPTGVVYGPTLPPAGLVSEAEPPPSRAGTRLNQPPEHSVGTPTGAPPALGAPGPAPEPAVAHEEKYVVQLSSQRSEAAAQATSKTLQTKYSEVLSGHQPFIRRSDLRDRGVYYRVQIGPFSTSGEANQLCRRLKKVGADCVVQKN
jgi:cell division septation protein DedD